MAALSVALQDAVYDLGSILNSTCTVTLALRILSPPGNCHAGPSAASLLCVVT